MNNFPITLKDFLKITRATPSNVWGRSEHKCKKNAASITCTSMEDGRLVAIRLSRWFMRADFGDFIIDSSTWAKIFQKVSNKSNLHLREDMS